MDALVKKTLVAGTPVVRISSISQDHYPVLGWFAGAPHPSYEVRGQSKEKNMFSIL